jgi:ATP-dependent helicase/nuclease subunit A
MGREMEFSAAQLGAVTRKGQDVCCVAGPGSGKTAVLIRRFLWLVENGADPAAILAITFTDKAAAQLKQRLVTELSENQERRRAVERAPVSTIHAFCRFFLLEHSLRAGLDPSFTVLDELDAKTIAAEAMEAALDRIASNRRDEFLELVSVWDGQALANDLLSIHEDLRMGGGAAVALADLPHFDAGKLLDQVERNVRDMLDAAPPPKKGAQQNRVAQIEDWLLSRSTLDALEWLRSFKINLNGLKPGNSIYDRRNAVQDLVDDAIRTTVGSRCRKQRELVRDILIEFEDEFNSRKRALGALDFDDLQEQTLRLLDRDPSIRDSTRERYEAVLMDELQDTNPVQWNIIDRIRRPGRFFAVGDVNQSIYGFRHADPRLFIGYRKRVEDAGGTIDRLENNYRSLPAILDAVSSISVKGSRPGIEPHQLLAARRDGGAGEPCIEIRRWLPRGDKSEPDAEADWIAARLQELNGKLLVGEPRRPASYGDMAVLARSASNFDELERAFQLYGIPYVLKRGRNFFATPEIVDLTNWLRVLENPSDELALFGLLRSPFFGVSDAEIAGLRSAGGLIPARAAQRIERARAFRSEVPADRILARELDETGYLSSLKNAPRANVAKFLGLLRDWEAAAPGDFAGHLDRISSLRAAGDEPGAPQLEAGDAVQVMTIHTAKGLEFPIVVVAFLNKGVKPTNPKVAWSPQTSLGIRWKPPDASESIPDPAAQAYKDLAKQREAAEADRLLYVGMTRAEDRLILSWTETKRPGSTWPAEISGALGVEWPENPNEPVATGHLRVLTCAGLPDAQSGSTPSALPKNVIEIVPREVRGEPESAVAATALARFSACPRRYFLDSILGWPAPSAEPASAAALGTEVHELLAGKLRTASAEARRMADSFQASSLGKRAAEASRIEREFDFLVQYGGVLLRGRIDLWFEEGTSSLVLVDYKTDRFLDEARLAEYGTQLRLYSAALETITGRAPTEAWICALRDGKEHRVALAPEELAKTRSEFEEFLRAEEEGVFETREGGQCKWCPFRGGACPVS